MDWVGIGKIEIGVLLLLEKYTCTSCSRAPMRIETFSKNEEGEDGGFGACYIHWAGS